jgi:long-chain acyl-CoA synthetase
MNIAPGLSRCPTIVHALAAAVAQVPFITALVCAEQSLSYAELGRLVSGLARRLVALGARGQRVVVLLPTSLEAVVSSLAVLAARAQLAPLDPSRPTSSLEPTLTEADPTLIICDATCAERLRAFELQREQTRTLVWGSELDPSKWLEDDSLDLSTLELPAPDELALLLFGSTASGAPQGIEHAHHGLALSLLQHCTCWPVAFGRDRFLGATPLFHVWGLVYATFVPIYARSTHVLVPGSDPEHVLAAIERHAITVLAGGPAAIYSALLGSPRCQTTSFSSLRHCLASGYPLSPQLREAWQRATARPLLDGWGLAEATPLCLSDARGPRTSGSVGRAVPLTRVSIVDVAGDLKELPAYQRGEVRVRGPQLMVGYRNHHEDTSAALRDGWLYTGVSGYLDEDGYLFLDDRES